jgi:hypothetical protein
VGVCARSLIAKYLIFSTRSIPYVLIVGPDSGSLSLALSEAGTRKQMKAPKKKYNTWFPQGRFLMRMQLCCWE